MGDNLPEPPPSRPAAAATTATREPLAPASAGRLFTWYWRAALEADPPRVTLVRIILGPEVGPTGADGGDPVHL